MSEKVEKVEEKKTEEKVEKKEEEEEKKEQEKDEIDEVLEELKEEEKPKEKEKYIIVYKERKPKKSGLVKSKQEPQQPEKIEPQEKGMDWGFIAILIGLLLLSIVMIYLIFSGGF